MCHIAMHLRSNAPTSGSDLPVEEAPEVCVLLSALMKFFFKKSNKVEMNMRKWQIC